MAKGKSELIVGLVVFIAVATLIFGLVWLKGFTVSQKYDEVIVSFTDIGSLSTGDPLAVSGVRSGKVGEIKLVKGVVHVTCLIDRTIELGRDASFSIKNVGVMGERFMAVKPGTSSVTLDKSQIVVGSYDTGIPEVMGMVGDMISEVRNLVHTLGGTIASPGTLNDFQLTMSQLRDLTEQLNLLVVDSKDSYRRSVKAIETASIGFEEFVTKNGPNAEQAINNMAEASEKLNSLTADLDTLSKSLNEFADKLNSDEGTLGLLASDQTLYQDVKKTVREVDKLVTDIRDNPRKYLNLEFSIF